MQASPRLLQALQCAAVLAAVFASDCRGSILGTAVTAHNPEISLSLLPESLATLSKSPDWKEV